MGASEISSRKEYTHGDGSSPAWGVALVTPSDADSLPIPSRAIRVTTAGNVKLVTAMEETVVCAFTAGETRPIRATKIFNTLTTATGIEVMY